ncbi:dihydrodipicolinate synthase family protein [Methylocaldum sp. MU1018]
MTEPLPIRGLWCAALTPLGRDGDVDRAKLAAHARALLANGVDGVVPFGTTGEGPSFSVAERRGGLDALLAAGDARLRVYLYHIPQLSGVPIRPEVVARLAAAYPGIVAGVKDSGGDFAHTAELLNRAPRLSILAGHEPHLPRLMRAGGAGTVCGVANLFPDLAAALLRPDALADDEARIRSLLDIVLRYPFVPAFKAVRAAQTGDPGWLMPKPPLSPLTEVERASLIAALHSAGFGIAPESGP